MAYRARWSSVMGIRHAGCLWKKMLEEKEENSRGIIGHNPEEKERNRAYQNTRHDRGSAQSGGQGGTGEWGDCLHVTHRTQARSGRWDDLCELAAARTATSEWVCVS